MSWFKKTILLSILIIVVGLIALNLYLFKFGGIEKIVNDQLASMLESRYNMSITIGEMGGNLYDGIILNDIELIYRGTSTPYTLLKIPTLSAGYSIRNLWNNDYLFSFLNIDSAHVFLKRDSTGKLLVPEFSFGTRNNANSTAANFAVDELHLNNFRVDLISARDSLAIKGLWLAVGVRSTGGGFAIDIERFEFQMSDERYRLDAAQGKVTLDQKYLLFKDIFLSSGDTRFRLNGNLQLSEPLSGRIDFDIDNANLDELTRMTSRQLKGLVDLNGYVAIDDRIIAGRTTVAGDFYIAHFDNLVTDFRFVDKHLYLDSLHGRLFGDCIVDGKAVVDFTEKPEQYTVTANVSHFNLKSLVKNSFESDLTGNFRLTGKSFKSESLVLDVDVELIESYFDNYPLQELYGSMTITKDAITLLDPFSVWYFENEFVTSGTIDYQGQIDLNIFADFGNLDRYRGKLFIDQPGGRGKATARMYGSTADPSLSGHFDSDSLFIYGLYSSRFSADFDLARFLTGRKGAVSLDLTSGSVWSLPYDSAHFDLSIDSNIVFIDSANIGNKHWNLDTRGRFDYAAYPMQMEADEAHLSVFDRHFVSRSPIKLAIDSLGMEFGDLDLTQSVARVRATGRINFDESLNLDVDLDEVETAPWLALFSDSLAIDGIVSCHANLEGSFLSPQIKLQGRIDSLAYRGLVLGDLHTSLYYRDELLQIDSMVVYAENMDSTELEKTVPVPRKPGEKIIDAIVRNNRISGRYHGRGFLPVNLSLSTVERIPDEPFDLVITAADDHFDLVSLLLPSVEQLDGDFTSQFRLTGTPNDPHLEGFAELKNGRLKYFDLEHPIFVDSISVTMVNNKISLGRINAYTTESKQRDGKSRDLIIEGELIVTAIDSLYYDIDVTLPKEFPFSYELDDITGKVEGELQIVGLTPPKVTGDLTLLSTRYMVNFAEPEEGSPLMAALEGENSWDLDINIDILSNYWIKNEDIDAEFSGDIEIIREKGKYRFIGEMEILRGKGYLFDKTFRLEPGGLVNFEGGERFNPRLDIIGNTRVLTTLPSQFENNVSSEHLEVGVHITGTLDTVEINPVEGSPLSREELLPLIVANYYSSDTAFTSGAQLQQRISGLVSTQVSHIGTRQLNQLGVGVETFEIEPVYGQSGDPLSARITLGFYTAPNLYVYGRSPISGQTGREVGFEYRFNRALLVEGQRDEEELYHLNLKLHLEF